MYLIRFEDDLEEIILETFRQLNVIYWDPKNISETKDKILKRYQKVHKNNDRLRILLRQYINVGLKFLPARRWKIEISSKLKDYKNSSFGQKLDFFIRKAQDGEEIRGFQSKKSLCAYDEDSLLNCWSIHHIHLSDKLSFDGIFYERSDFILMIHQSIDTLFLIDVIPHRDYGRDPCLSIDVNLAFSRKHIFETFVREFPRIAAKWRLNGLIAGNNHLSDFEIRSARKHGLQTCIEVDGAIYVGGYGIATSTSGVQATMQTDRYLKMLYDWRKHIEENYELILQDLGLKKDVTNPAMFRLRLENVENEFIVYEQKTSIFMKDFSENVYFRR